MDDRPQGRDRLRELLDAVLDEENRTLADMAGDAYSSPYHFSRRLRRDAWPLFPRPFDLRLVEQGRNGAFLCATYDVVGRRAAA